jgi:hypothetical protein
MLDHALMKSVALQMMGQTQVSVENQVLRVTKTSSTRLRVVNFTMNERKYSAIEQNPNKPSRWGKLARQGKQVVQFKDVEKNKFIAVSVDGEVKEYGR